MPKFRKKPVEIDAVLFDGTYDSFIKIQELAPQHHIRFENSKLHISTLEGIMEAKPGDYIIRGIAGELYPCDQLIFRLTYEPI